MPSSQRKDLELGLHPSPTTHSRLLRSFIKGLQIDRGLAGPQSDCGPVKSKVAGNMKSIKKSQTRAMIQRAQQEEGTIGEGVPRRAKTYTSPKKTRKAAGKVATDHD